MITQWHTARTTRSSQLDLELALLNRIGSTSTAFTAASAGTPQPRSPTTTIKITPPPLREPVNHAGAKPGTLHQRLAGGSLSVDGVAFCRAAGTSHEAAG